MFCCTQLILNATKDMPALLMTTRMSCLKCHVVLGAAWEGQLEWILAGTLGGNKEFVQKSCWSQGSPESPRPVIRTGGPPPCHPPASVLSLIRPLTKEV